LVPIWQWVAVAAGLFGSAFFSSSETALTALGEARVASLIEQGGTTARPLRLWQRDPDRVLSALLIGNTLVNVGMGILATMIAEGLGVGDHPAILTGVTTCALLTFGEITPKTFAKRYASSVAVAAMPLVALTAFLLWPVVLIFSGVPRLLQRALGVEGPSQSPVTSQELGYLIEHGARHGALDAASEELLSSVLKFSETRVKEIMVPRTQVVALEATATYEETLKLVTESELSRIPVYRETMDEVIGVLQSRQFLAEQRGGVLPAAFTLSRYIKPPFFVPDAMKVARVLSEMQKRKTHLAIVVDEHGGTSGIATLEDVLEEIVGEIHDESDVEVKRLRVLQDGVVLADAQVAIRDVEEQLGVEFPEGDFDTLGGFLTATAGRVPPAGSLVVWGPLTFTVKAADEKRVLRVEIARAPERPASRPPPEKSGPQS
jgi:CBS domain containing-hemolysin-like protein